MKKFRLSSLEDVTVGHFLGTIVPGTFIYQGGFGFKKRGERTHSHDDPAQDRHVHDDNEVFVILQGKARMDINGEMHDLVTGDICVVEPGEDHHLISDPKDPCVNMWLHTSDSRHEIQEA